MSPLFATDGRRKLREAVLIFATCLAVSAAVIGASHWFLQKERREGRATAARLAQAQARVERIRKERDSLDQSSEVFRAIRARGLMKPESRLELVELMNGLRARHAILALDYEIAPQRPLAVASGVAFTAVDILSSRVTLKLRALHEGDAVAFFESLAQSRQGFYPVDRCVMRRLEVTNPQALQPRIEAECTLEWITMKEKRVA